MMPLDPTNAPFQRGAIASDADDAQAATALKAESILLEEYNFAGVMAYQARQDSATLINMYLLATGALVTGLGVLVNAYSSTTKVTVSIIAVTALSIFAIFGFAFFARFLGLEQEYRDGIQAMGVIREFYIQRLRRQMPEIELAFHWRLKRRPRGATLAGGSPLLAWVIALITALTVAGVVGDARQLYSVLTDVYVHYATETALGLTVPFFWELLAGLLALALHITYFYLVVRRYRERARAEALRQAAHIEATLGQRA